MRSSTTSATSSRSLGGRYITAEDIGTATEDMVEIATRTSHVTGCRLARRRGRPEPVHGARRPGGDAGGLPARAFGTSNLAGRSVAVVGLGHVGARLAQGLAAAGPS